MHYHSGVYENEYCGSSLNHGVLAVGFENEDDTKIPFFLVKNSWGEEWGDEGYIKMAIGKKAYGTCGIASENDVYPVL